MATDEPGELDYHITFPSPGIQNVYDDDSVEESTSDITSKEPVVILLGWMGCQEKHLAKYSAIYDEKGCITIRYTAPTNDIMYRSGNLKTSAYRILELVTDLGVDENPILFHVFSNGGGFLYRHVSEILCTSRSKEFQNINVIGCIFDSCPSERSIVAGTKAFMYAVNTNIVFTYILGFLMFCVLFLQLLVYKLNIFAASNTFWDYMMNETGRWPQMYLYSKADALINYKYVDFVISHRRKLGVEVFSHCWDDSKHVQHFMKHREAYINICYNFLSKCLDINEICEGEVITSKFD